MQRNKTVHQQVLTAQWLKQMTWIAWNQVCTRVSISYVQTTAGNYCYPVTVKIQLYDNIKHRNALQFHILTFPRYLYHFQIRLISPKLILQIVLPDIGSVTTTIVSTITTNVMETTIAEMEAMRLIVPSVKVKVSVELMSMWVVDSKVGSKSIENVENKFKVSGIWYTLRDIEDYNICNNYIAISIVKFIKCSLYF